VRGEGGNLLKANAVNEEEEEGGGGGLLREGGRADEKW